MTGTTVAVLALLVFAWAVLSGPLTRRNLTAPLLFTACGYLLSNNDWGPLPVDVDTAVVHTIAEVTLALVLFADASRIDLGQLRHDAGLPLRLLAIGLPLTVLAGTALAGSLLGGLPVGLALFVGAALAPTDAALSVQVITDERVPRRIRRSLNVESGLNDGIVTPIVALALAIAVGELSGIGDASVTDAARELAGGVGIGVLAGWGGGWAIAASGRRGWITADGRQLAGIAIALCAFATAGAAGANGFIAAFVAGIAFGATPAVRVPDSDEAGDALPELSGELLALVVWFLFGAALVPVAFRHVTWQIVVYALASLTVLRMLPVAVALLGTGLDRRSVGFIAWFGPRGLASVVFAVLAIEELGESVAATDVAVGAVTLTVLASVVLHGITAGPAGKRWAGTSTGADGAVPRTRSGLISGRHHRRPAR